MTNEQKLQDLINWLDNNDYEFEQAKTNSIYTYVSTDNHDGWLKISNHQLVEITDGFRAGKTRMLKANKENNLKLLKDGEDYLFANLNKYYYEYGNSQTAPSFWLPISGNWSLKKVKEIIKGL